jgi:hypothetical protein
VNQKLPVFVRLIRFVCLWFIVAFVALSLAHFLAIRIDLARMFSFVRQEGRIDSLLTAGWRSLSPSIYIAMLFGLSYSARYNFPVILSIIYVLILSLLWIGLLSLTLSLIQGGAPWPTETSRHLGGVGLITMEGDQSQMFLQDPDLSGIRVIAPPDLPLVYEDSQTEVVPSVFFRNDSVYFIEAMLDDFTYAGEQCKARIGEGVLSFFLYILALVFCLSALRFVFDASSWPLANLFLGALLFRGVLEVETQLNSEQARTFISAISGDRFPMFMVVPLALCALGLVFLLLTFGTLSIKKRRTYEDY